jgi:hypothetical protein
MSSIVLSLLLTLFLDRTSPLVTITLPGVGAASKRLTANWNDSLEAVSTFPKECQYLSILPEKATVLPWLFLFIYLLSLGVSSTLHAG